MEKKLRIILALLKLTPAILAVVKAQKTGTDAEQDAAVEALIDALCVQVVKLYPDAAQYEAAFKGVVIAIYNTFDD